MTDARTLLGLFAVLIPVFCTGIVDADSGGVLQAVSTSGTDAVNTVAGPDVVFGAFEAGGVKTAFYPGLLDDVRIYNTALTEAEIQAIVLEVD